MQVETLGEGEPGYTVVGGIHGDEPCGPKAIRRFIEEKTNLKKPVQFIVANEEALEKGARYLESDLNRSFPGDPEGGHEKRLAAEIMEKVRGTRVLDLHSTQSYGEPFATLSRLNDTTLSMVRSSGASYAVYFPESSGTLNELVDGIVVEAGFQGTEAAADNAYHVMKNFLAAEGVMDADYRTSTPEIFEYYDTVEGEGYEFVARNFQLVEEGEVFARKTGDRLVASEDFYPVLMSTNGYERIVGYKARKLESEKVQKIVSDR